MNPRDPRAGQPLTELDVADCWRLVENQVVGRLVWNGRDGLTAVPVNYVARDGVVLVRTTAYSGITRECDDSLVAFEIDSFDPSERTGWSVLLRGRAELAFADSGAGLDAGDDPGEEVEPWPTDPRPIHLRLEPTTVTGRWLGPPAQ